MPRLTAGMRLGVIALCAMLIQSCGDDHTPTVPKLSPDAPRLAGGGSIGVNLDQCANLPLSGPCSWQNGDLNGNNSAYAEGHGVPFRLALEGLSVGTHTIHVNYDFTAGGNEGYDFLADFDLTENVTLCASGGGGRSSLCDPPFGGLTKANATAITEFPSDATVIPGANSLTVAGAELAGLFGANTKRHLYVWGATDVTITPADPTHTGPTTGNSSADFVVSFKSTGSAVAFAWSAHLAQSNYWKNADGTPDGAGEISGAPWHMRTQQLDGTGGNKNQDRSIQPSAIVQLTPGAKIELSPLTATNSIGDPHTVTVTVSERADTPNPYVPAAGETVTYTITSSNGATAIENLAASTCDDQKTDANGQCKIVFSSATAGTVTVHAASNVVVGSATIPVASGTGGDNSADAVKTYVSGTLSWSKVDGDAQNAPIAGAVFTVCGPTYPSCIDVSDNVNGSSTLDTDPAGGKFTLVNLDVGTYTVTEKTPPAGYNKITGQQSAMLTLQVPNATIALPFVNRAPTAFITIGPKTATNSTTEAHTFTATMTVDPKGGGTPTIGAISITVAPAPSTLGTVDCTAAQAGPDQNGLYTRSCTLTINSTTAGTFVANASGSAVVGAVTLNRASDGNATLGNSGSAEKIYLAPALTIDKTPKSGSIVAGNTATFTIVVKNTGLGKAFGVALSDQLRNNLTWSIGSASPEWNSTCAIDGAQKLTCGKVTLNAGASATVSVSAFVSTGFVFQPPVANGTKLEMDGNLVSDGGTDWANSGIDCLSNPLSGCALDATGATDNSFGNGTKEDSPIPSITDGSIPPNKSDLLRFYVLNNRVTVAGGAVHDFLYLAWERVLDPQGTTNMDFEFNQNTTLTSNGETPVRKAGDVLIKYDLSNGGGNLSMGFHRWVETGACEASGAKPPCWGPVNQLVAGTFEGRANDPSVPTNGNVVDPLAPNAPRTLSPLTFGEASIDLQAAQIFTPGQCLSFGRAYLKSRSSDSFTAAIKDYVKPIPVSLTNCQAATIPNTASVTADNATGGSSNGLITVTVP